MECPETESLTDTRGSTVDEIDPEQEVCDNTKNEEKSKTCPSSDSKNRSDCPTKDPFYSTENSNSIVVKNEAVMETEDGSNKNNFDSFNGYSIHDNEGSSSRAEANVGKPSENVTLECELDLKCNQTVGVRIKKLADKDLESVEAELEIDAENEGEISDGDFPDEAIEASEGESEITHQNAKLKSEKNVQSQNENSKCKDVLSEDGELSDHVNDDFEEGEVKDDDSGMVTCRFFARGNCMYGSSCHFMHVTDKGLYKMFDAVDVNINIRPMVPFIPKPELVLRPPPVEPEIEFRHIAWERGLRLAKEQRKLALEKKSDPEFDEKNLYMNLNDNLPPSDRVRNPLLERQVIKRSPNDYYINARKGNVYDDQFQKARGLSYKTNQFYAKYSSPLKLNKSYEGDITAKRASDKIEWRDPWRRSKSPVARKRSHSPSSYTSASRSSSLSSSRSSSQSSDFRQKKHLAKKHCSPKGRHRHRSGRVMSPAKDASRKSLSRSSTSRSLSTSSEERLKFRKEVYCNPAMMPSVQSNLRRSKHSDKLPKKKFIKTYVKDSYESPDSKPYLEKFSVKGQPPKTTPERYRRSSSRSTCQSYGSTSRSFSSASLRSRSNSPLSWSSHYSVRSSYSSKSYTNQTSTKQNEQSPKDLHSLKDSMPVNEKCLETSSEKKLEVTDHSQSFNNVISASKLSFKIISKQSSFDVPPCFAKVEEHDSEKIDKGLPKCSHTEPMDLNNVKKDKDSEQICKGLPNISHTEQVDVNNVKKKVSQTAKKQAIIKGAGILLKYHALSKKRYDDGEPTENFKSVIPSSNITKPNLNKNSNMTTLDKKINKESEKCQTPKVLLPDRNSITLESFFKIREVRKIDKPVIMLEKHKNRPFVSPKHVKLHSSSTKGSKNLDISHDIPSEHNIINFSSYTSHTKPLTSKSRIMMNLLTDVTKPQEVKRVSKRPAAPIASKHPVKELSNSRRDVLLKQLKAVEDAIARKKAKYD